MEAHKLVIGRSASSDIVLADNTVSGKHAEISISPDGALYLRDLHSTNGTFINGKQVNGKQQLKPGDEVRLGKKAFEWENIIASDIPEAEDTDLDFSDAFNGVNPEATDDERTSAKEHIVAGVLWAIGGIAITAGTYAAADFGEAYIVSVGPIAYGVIRFFIGLLMLIRA